MKIQKTDLANDQDYIDHSILFYAAMGSLLQRFCPSETRKDKITAENVISILFLIDGYISS